MSPRDNSDESDGKNTTSTGTPTEGPDVHALINEAGQGLRQMDLDELRSLADSLRQARGTVSGLTQGASLSTADLAAQSDEIASLLDALRSIDQLEQYDGLRGVDPAAVEAALADTPPAALLDQSASGSTVDNISTEALVAEVAARRPTCSECGAIAWPQQEHRFIRTEDDDLLCGACREVDRLYQ